MDSLQQFRISGMFEEPPRIYSEFRIQRYLLAFNVINTVLKLKCASTWQHRNIISNSKVVTIKPRRAILSEIFQRYKLDKGLGAV